MEMVSMKEIRYQDLLKGKYEADLLPGNISSANVVPGYAYNVLASRGLLHQPVADEHHLAGGMEKIKWPEGKPFAVCLTHDVDAVSSVSLPPADRFLSWESSHHSQRGFKVY